jgi:ferredoxin
MYCGLCVEACPYDAIQAGGTFRDAVYFFDDMYQDKYKLTKLAHEHLRANDYSYPNGMKAPQSLIDFVEAEERGEEAPPPQGTHAQIAAQPAPGVPPGSPSRGASRWTESERPQAEAVRGG